MNRFIPLLLCLIVGCGSANAGFLASPSQKPRSQPTPKVEKIVRDNPTPVTPVISLPEKITANPGAWIVLKAITNCPHVVWLNEDDNLNVLPEELLSDPFVTVASCIIPGEYRIKAIAALADQPVQSNWCIITVLGAQPPPGPGPAPVPPVPPVPPTPVVVKSANLTVVTLDDATKRTPALAAMLGDPYWQIMATKGHTRRQYNTTNQDAMTTYAEQLRLNGGLPCVIIMDSKTLKWLNKSPDDLKLPANPQSLKALISKYTDNL